MAEFIINDSWNEKLKPEFEKEYFINLKKYLEVEIKTHEIYPPEDLIFSAFNFTPFDKIKIVILGQDPYHGKGQANGLCFSVNNNIKIPPSLKNIFKEIRNDYGCELPETGNLENWAKQGVFLLNAVLTVEENKAGSHQKIGWEQFTDEVIKIISEKHEHVVFMLWGNYAKAKACLINSEKHLILQSAHPSPLARGAFFGKEHFKKANTYLTEHKITPVNWCL